MYYFLGTPSRRMNLHYYVSDNWQIQAAMFMLGRLFATYAMDVGFQFTVEVFISNETFQVDPCA